MSKKHDNLSNEPTFIKIGVNLMKRDTDITEHHTHIVIVIVITDLYDVPYQK